MTLNKFTVISTFLPFVFGEITVFPVGGPGKLVVTPNGDSESRGCLDSDGKWTINESNCADVFGNGQGGISSPTGWYVLDDDANITVTTTTWTTAWVGAHVDTDKRAIYLQGNVGKAGISEPWGGPLWYADQAPADAYEVVILNGHNIDANEHVTITFEPTNTETAGVFFNKPAQWSLWKFLVTGEL